MDEERYRAVLTDLQQVVGGNPLEFDEHGVCYLVWEGAGTLLAAWEQEGPARLLDRFGERAHSLSALLADEADKADTFRTEKEFIPSFALRV